jgi:hypothetical protein
MNEKKLRKKIFAEKSKKVEDYVRKYQASFRDLLRQLPDDEQFEPQLIEAVIGRVEIYPCKDAAIVLTYADNSNEINIKIKDPLNQTVTEFTKKSNVFTYFDKYGASTSIRISFNEDVPNETGIINGFLHKKHHINDVIAWGNDINFPNEKYEKDSFFRPRFKRMSVLGWESSLSNPIEDATKDIQKAYAFSNILKTIITGINKFIQNRKLIEVGDQLVTEFEETFNSKQPKESIKAFLKEHPELIHPSYLRCYSDVVLGNEHIADFLVLVWDKGLKCLLVKLEDIKAKYFDFDNQASQAFTKNKVEFSEWEELLSHNSSSISPKINSKWTIQLFYLLMGRDSQLTYLQKKELLENHCQIKQYFSTYDALTNKFKVMLTDVAGIWDQHKSVEEQLQKLGIFNDEDFDSTMKTIDQEMHMENIPIPAFPIEGWLRFSSVFGLYLVNSAPLSRKINDWFNRKYGNNLKVDFTWKFLVSIRENLYKLRIPLIFGTAEIICSPEHFGITKTQVSSAENLPVINILDLIENFTKEQSQQLSQQEVINIFNQFQFGFSVLGSLDSILEINLAKDAKQYLGNCAAYFLECPVNYKQLKENLSLATKILLEAFIAQKGETIEEFNALNELKAKAESAGLREIPSNVLEKLEQLIKLQNQLSPDSTKTALEIYYSTLDICAGIANQIYLIRNYKQVSELEPDKFYTNSLGKIYRCIKVEKDDAEIMLFDEVMGNTLEILFSQNRNYWYQYYLVEDKTILEKFEKRYKSLADNKLNEDKK